MAQDITLVNATNSNDELERIEIELLLEGIYRYYGFDFRNYAYSFLRRRIWNRVELERLNNISGLQEKVLHQPETASKLFNDLSITVTEMFRDPGFFAAFRAKVIPMIRGYSPVRIWHAGCATGEEVYSMAILLHEEGLYQKVRIYATDINETMLTKAKQGIFPLERMQAYTKNYLAAGGTKAFSEYYTVKKNRGVVFDPGLSKNIVIAPHNLAIDRSFNEFQVIVCRNVIIYFNRFLQDHVYGLFYESLSPEGFLCLGSKEELKYTKWNRYYERISHGEKIYRKSKAINEG